MRPFRPRHRDRGASALEYAAVLALVAALVGGFMKLALPTRVGSNTKAAICRIFQSGTKCAGATASPVASSSPCQAFCPTATNPIHPSDPVTAATKGNYVALGDSYSSGEGAIDYDPKSSKDKCHRSANAYSQVVDKKYRFNDGTSFFACSGATTDNLLHGQNGEPAQIVDNPNLNAKTTLVTLSIGGNDLGFADVVTACAMDLHVHWPWDHPTDQCHAQQASIQQKMKALFGPPEPSKYEKVLEQIHSQAPNARIVVVGYPQLFPDPPEHDYLNFTKDDQAFLNNMAKQVDQKIQEQVQAEDQKYYGNGKQAMGSFEYVDTNAAFKGHHASSIPWESPWIHPIWLNCQDGSFNTKDKCVNPGSFHPTKEGQAAMANVVNNEIANGPGRTLYDP